MSALACIGTSTLQVPDETGVSYFTLPTSARLNLYVAIAITRSVEGIVQRAYLISNMHNVLDFVSNQIFLQTF